MFAPTRVNEPSADAVSIELGVLATVKPDWLSLRGSMVNLWLKAGPAFDEGVWCVHRSALRFWRTNSLSAGEAKHHIVVPVLMADGLANGVGT